MTSGPFLSICLLTGKSGFLGKMVELDEVMTAEAIAQVRAMI